MPPNIHSKALLALFILIASLAVALFNPLSLEGAEPILFGVLLLCIGFFATGVIPEYQTALLFFLLCMLFSLSPADVVFSGFMSGAFWLVFGGLIVGIAIKETGLGEKLAQFISNSAPPTYFGIISGIVISGVVLSFLMPSSFGRLALFMPIALAIAKHYGFQPGSKGHNGVVLAAVFGTNVPGFTILTANAPNIIMAGTAESLHGIHIYYGEYLMLFFPVLGILKALILIFIILYLYPDSPKVPINNSPQNRGLSSQQKKLAWLVAVATLLWMSDWIHGLSPAWIALSAALFLMLPGNGISQNEDYLRKINFGPLLFAAGIIGLGAVIAHTGIGAWLGDIYINLFPDSPSPFESYLYLSLISSVTGLFTTLPGIPAILSPLAEQFSEITGFSVHSILLTQIIGFSTLLLPYQAPPVLVGIQIGGIKIKEAIKTVLVLAFITIMVLLPLQFFWWSMLQPF